MVSFTERFTVQGIEPDGFEPDDEPESAREIRLGAPPQHRTLPDGESNAGRYGLSVLQEPQ